MDYIKIHTVVNGYGKRNLGIFGPLLFNRCPRIGSQSQIIFLKGYSKDYLNCSSSHAAGTHAVVVRVN